MALFVLVAATRGLTGIDWMRGAVSDLRASQRTPRPRVDTWLETALPGPLPLAWTLEGVGTV